MENTNRPHPLVAFCLVSLWFACPALSRNVAAPPRATIVGGTAYTCMPSVKPGRESTVKTVVQAVSLDASANIQQYELPFANILAAPAEAPNYPQCVRFSSEQVVSLNVHELVPAQPSFVFQRIGLGDIRCYASTEKGTVPPEMVATRRQLTNKRSDEQFRAEPLEIITSFPGSQPQTPAYDFFCLDDSTIILCILLDGHMTIWAKRSWDADNATLPFSGPSLYGDGDWIQVRTIVAPLTGPFDTYASGRDLYVHTATGAVLSARGALSSDPRASGSQPAILRSTVGRRSRSIEIEADLLTRLVGQPDRACSLQALSMPSRVEQVIVDHDCESLYFVTRGAVFGPNSCRIPFQEPPAASIPPMAQGPMRDFLKALPGVLNARQAKWSP